MARSKTASVYEEITDETEELEAPRATTRPHATTRRRIKMRRPEEMAGLTVSHLIPNCYLKPLMQAYFADEGVTRQGRKLPEATMVRRLLIQGLASLTSETEEEVTEAMAEAEAEEAMSIARNRERYGL